MNGVLQRISALVVVSRSFWRSLTRGELEPVAREIASQNPEIAQKLVLPAHEYAVLPDDKWDIEGLPSGPGTRDALDALHVRGQIVILDNRTYAHRSLLDPLRLNSQLIKAAFSSLEPNDIQYFVMREIRKHYRVTLTGGVSSAFQTLASSLNSALAGGNRQHSWLGSLRDAMLVGCNRHEDAAKHLDLFMECCRTTNLFSIGPAAGELWFYGQVVDGEYLLSRLFGLPVRIPGFDKLVGGGGLYLLDDLNDLHEGRSRDALPGRVVLATGRFGTGKSLLALQFAVEVARKGGIAWVMPLEQSFSECIYALESMGMRLTDGAFRVARNPLEAEDLWEGPTDGRGALVFLRHPKDSYSEFLQLIEEHADNLSHYELRLLVIDPISAVHREKGQSSTELRSATVDVLRKLKDKVVNIWINAEEDSMEGEHEFFEQNIADTVISLSADAKDGPTQRYIEITKSRLQREIRGRQPFSITPRRGIELDLSAEAWTQIARGRIVRPQRETGAFGTEGMDQILGENGVGASDIVVLQGPEGSSKTLIGLQFLLEYSHKRESRSFGLGHSLLVTDQHPVSTLRRLEQMDPSEKRKSVHIVSVDKGYVQPGHIFRQIDDELRRVRAHTPNFVDRVMIDNLARWEMSCPFIAQDRTFGVSLVEYLRRHSVTTVITCGDQSEGGSGSVLQKSVIDSADCLIRFSVHDVQGRSTVFVRVLRTRDMRHRREMFELVPNGYGVRAQGHPSPLRIDASGKMTPPRVRLVLHRETETQHGYNEGILAAVKASISHDAHIEEPPEFNTLTLSLGAASMIDEVQIVQLDEYQIPGDTSLHLMEDKPGRPPYVARLERKVARLGGLIVAPYYINISLLAFRKEVGAECLATWRSLARACQECQGTGVFFDIAFPNIQSYNCLFLEILIGNLKELADKPWLALYSSASPEDFRDALGIFRTLCTRAYHWHRSVKDAYIPQARVWRHWYGTAGRMIDELRFQAPARQTEISVRPLPHNITSAGEWYLGVPAYSDSPGIAEGIIRIYTSEQAERERLRLEVGLPCNSRFYSAVNSPGELRTVSRYFSFELPVLRDMIENAIERSALPGYSKWSWTLAAQLQRVLELDGDGELEMDQIAHSLHAESLSG